MPTQNTIETIRLPGWDGGLNTDADEFQLELNESPDCLNVDFGLRGAVSKREGYTRYDSPAETNTYRGLYAWQKRGGSHFLVGAGADLISSAGAAFDNQAHSWDAVVTKDDWHVGFAAFENVLYVSSKNGDTWKFDGTTWTQITDNTLDGSGTEFPHAALLETNYERVWAANLFNNTTEYASRVHYSNIGDAETWDALDWIDVDPDDGYVITGLKVFGGNLLIWKERAVYTLSGSDENSFTLYVLDSDIGTNCPRTIASEGDRVIFFDPLSGVWQFNGASFDKLDDKINLYLLDNINYDEAHKSSGFIWQGRYYLSVPWTSSAYPNRTFVYDLRTGAWTQYDYGVQDWTNRETDVYTATVDNGNGVYKMFDGLTDNGTAVSSYVETAWLAPENEAVKQRLRRADFSFSALGNHDVTIKMNRDFSVDPIYTKTVNTSPGGGLWGTMNWGDDWGLGVDQVFVQETGWPSRWRTMQLRFEENTSTGQWQINRVLLHVSSLSRVRGEA